MPKLKQLFMMGNCISDLMEFSESNLGKLELINIYDSPATSFPFGRRLKPLEIFMKGAQVTDFSELEQYSSEIFRLHYNEGVMPEIIPTMKFSKANRIQF